MSQISRGLCQEDGGKGATGGLAGSGESRESWETVVQAAQGSGRPPERVRGLQEHLSRLARTGEASREGCSQPCVQSTAEKQAAEKYLPLDSVFIKV